jgi:hypothetical protein
MSASFSLKSLVMALILAFVLCLSSSSEATCIISSSYSDNRLNDVCSYSLPDCSNITTQNLLVNYGLGNIQVAGSSKYVTVSGIGQLNMIKMVLVPNLLACSKNGVTTLYGVSSVTA